MSSIRVISPQQQPQQTSGAGSAALVTFDAILWRWTVYSLMLNAVLFIILYASYAIRQQFVLKYFPGRTGHSPEKAERVKAAVLRARHGGGGST